MAHFAIPSHILVGKDALPSAVPYLKTYGNRAFIVTGKHVGKSPMMEQLKKTLETAEIAYYVFDGITGEPTDKMIEEGLAQYKKTGCQFIIGIGGGSPLDSAKAIAAMAVNEGKIADYNGKEITGSVDCSDSDHFRNRIGGNQIYSYYGSGKRYQDAVKRGLSRSGSGDCRS